MLFKFAKGLLCYNFFNSFSCEIILLSTQMMCTKYIKITIHIYNHQSIKNLDLKVSNQVKISSIFDSNIMFSGGMAK